MNNGASTSNRKRRHDHPNSIHIALVNEGETSSKYVIHLLRYINGRMSSDRPQNFRFPYIHDVGNYEKMMKIGQGTFGEVFKARCKRTERFVALKKILMENEKEGFPITAIREVKMLQRLRSDNITELIEICNKNGAKSRDKSAFYLVFKFCDFDLAGLLSHPSVKLAIDDIKGMMKHLLNGLFHIHTANILHRDMKTANILVSIEGVLKLADFGLSRNMPRSSKPINYTNRVVTLWYRPPELLLGSRRYGPAIDLYGAGCIMAELWTQVPILQGDTEQRQLELIQIMCGGISPNIWPGVEQLPLYNKMVLYPEKPRKISEKLSPVIKKSISDMTSPCREQNISAALHLIDQLLILDPSRRITAARALDEDFFFIAPVPRENIAHVVKNLPKNIFEFTAGRGAHAGRQRHNQIRPAAQPSSQQQTSATNGTDRRSRPYVNNPRDSQLQDIIY